jgi:hypothetical protein
LQNFENTIENASLKIQFDNWYLTMHLFSLNGSKYDINVMKQFLRKSSKDLVKEVAFTIKKGNAYTSLKNRYNF